MVICSGGYYGNLWWGVTMVICSGGGGVTMVICSGGYYGNL